MNMSTACASMQQLFANGRWDKRGAAGIYRRHGTTREGMQAGEKEPGESETCSGGLTRGEWEWRERDGKGAYLVTLDLNANRGTTPGTKDRREQFWKLDVRVLR
jgi:hypothetical protein